MTNILNKERILQLAEHGLFPGGVHVFESIESTNDWSLEAIKQGREPPFVCITDHQSKGRGRRGRHWLSPASANIYISLAWHFELPVGELCALSLAQGVAVINTLRQAGINDAWLKWPNDVLINADKIAGVLIETSGVRANSCNAVIGIGLNYRMPDNIMPESGMRFTDVAHASGDRLPERSDLVAMLLNEMVNMCRQYQLKGASILSDIKHELDVLTGKVVAIHVENADHVTATVVGINHRGELRVLVDGQERVFNSVDISIKALSDQAVSGELC